MTTRIYLNPEDYMFLWIIFLIQNIGLRIEGSIRKFVIGRSNFIAVDTVEGAKASAICYSIVISAQENGLNVYEYLKYLFQELPKRRKNKDDSILENCLPWSKTLPIECHLKKDSKDDSIEQLKISTT